MRAYVYDQILRCPRQENIIGDQGDQFHHHVGKRRRIGSEAYPQGIHVGETVGSHVGCQQFREFGFPRNQQRKSLMHYSVTFGDYPICRSSVPLAGLWRPCLRT